MAELLLFAEDDALEKFIGTLAVRIAHEHGLSVRLRVRSARGGFGKVLQELQRFTAACDRGAEAVPDVIVVAVDANCHGLNDRRAEVEACAGGIVRERLVIAVADPHVERWFLLDGAAFRAVLGHGCQAPDQKCEKDRYKGLLIRAVQDAGVQPLLGGIEYAEDLANQMDLQRAGAADAGIRRFVDTLRARFNTLTG